MDLVVRTRMRLAFRLMGTFCSEVLREHFLRRRSEWGGMDEKTTSREVCVLAVGAQAHGVLG